MNLSEDSEVSSEVMSDVSGEVDQAVDEVACYFRTFFNQRDVPTPTVSLKTRLQQ